MLGPLRRRFRSGQLLPYRWTHLGGLLNTLLLVHLRRPVLRLRARRTAARPGADVTVLLAHRNRADYRLVNALRALTTQRYPRGRVLPLVVDYGSDPDHLEELRRITRALGVACLEVTGVTRWNKSHCLNIGLRRVRTQYLMVCDVDVILAPDYLEHGVASLEADPLAMVLSPCLHLPAQATPTLLEAAHGTAPCDSAALRRLGSVRTAHGYSAGMLLVRTTFVEQIGGYDERYQEYGAEDDDMVLRLQRLGLHVRNLGGTSYYLHQWHERHEGVRDLALESVIAANARRLASTRSIRRNPAGWGQAELRPRPGD